MKQLISIYRNPRCVIILALGLMALLLLIAESDSITAFAVSKVLSLGTMLIDYRLYSYWSSKGLINPLSHLEDE